MISKEHLLAISGSIVRSVAHSENTEFYYDDPEYKSHTPDEFYADAVKYDAKLVSLVQDHINTGNKLRDYIRERLEGK